MANTMDLITTQTATGPIAAFTVNMPSSSYKDVVIICSLKPDSGVVGFYNVGIQVNGSSTGADYRENLVYSYTGQTAGGSALTRNGSETKYSYTYSTSNSGTSLTNGFGITHIYIPQFANTTSSKSMGLTSQAWDNYSSAGNAIQAYTTYNYNNTNAISYLTVYPIGPSNWTTNSSVAVYGIKNS